MYQLAGLGFNSLTGGNQVVAYADFNNDKLYIFLLQLLTRIALI